MSKTVNSMDAFESYNEKVMNGAYLVDVEQPPDDDDDWPEFPDRVQTVFTYCNGSELIEIQSRSDEAIDANVKYDERGKKVYDVYRYNRVDAGRTLFTNVDRRKAMYSNIKPLFDSEELQNIFRVEPSIDDIYMECQIAQHCKYHQEQTIPEMYLEVCQAINEYRNNENVYPGYDPDFKMPTPEEIKQLRKAAGLPIDHLD